MQDKKNDVSSENFGRNEACKQSVVQNDSQFVERWQLCISMLCNRGTVRWSNLMRFGLTWTPVLLFTLYRWSNRCFSCFSVESDHHMWRFTKKSSDAFSKFRNHYQVTSCLKCCLEHVCFPEVEYSDYYKPNKSQKQPVASGIKLQHVEF